MFKCNFPLTALVTSAEVSIKKPESVTATATGVGSWEDAFTLKYYNDEFSETIDSITANIGDALYAKATFVISGDDLKLGISKQNSNQH